MCSSFLEILSIKMGCTWRILIVMSYVIIASLKHVNCLESTTIRVVAPNSSCIQCICELVSGCNLQIGCNKLGECGPFRMTQPFWVDAGTPVLKLDNSSVAGAFARCANDPYCARQATETYYRLYAKDCNNDGVIDCEDYAIIHGFGYVSCKKFSLSIERLRLLKKCLEENKIP